MRSSDIYNVHLTSAGKNERGIERELIMRILEKIDNLKQATYRQAKQFDELMGSTEFELCETTSDMRYLNERLTGGFESVKDLFRRPYPISENIVAPDLAKFNLRDLCWYDEIDHKEQWQTNTELLTKVSDKLAEIEEYTVETNGEFLEGMESMKTDVKELRSWLKDMDNDVEKGFSEVKELIQKNCTMYKEEEEDELLASIGVI